MTFQQLQYFLEVHRTGSVTRAAKNLFVSYPSVSVAIANIEKELGVVLFTRGPKGLSLTEQGQHVLEYANTITQAYMQMNSLRQEGRRTVRINAGDYETFGTAFAKLIEEYIGIDLPDDQVNQLVEGIKAKIKLDKLGGALGGLGGLFGKK